MGNALVRLIGFPATLIHGDTLVLDRWYWIMNRLPVNSSGHEIKLLDVGCGSGAFTIGSALRGYKSRGLSWDERNNNNAIERARICKAKNASFSICDVRDLDKEKDLIGQFDYIICTENIEHIINDRKLMIDMSNCLKIGGKLLLTTPNFDFIPMYSDKKIMPDPPVEDGGHVRIGYTPADLGLLCQQSGFKVDEISYCSGFFSQKVTSVIRFLSTKVNLLVGWAVTLPLRVLPPLFDPHIKYTGFSICLVATKTSLASSVESSA